MKKLLFTIAAFALIGITTVSAQGFKGKWFALGQASYGSQADNKIKNYSILPVVGTFVAPTTAIGLGIGYIGSKNETIENTVAKAGTFVVQPLARKYWPVTENFLIFGQAAVPMYFIDNTTEISGADKVSSKATSIGIQIAPGIDYFLSKNFSIEANFGLINWQTTKPKGGESSSEFDINVNSGFLGGLNIGLKYIF